MTWFLALALIWTTRVLAGDVEVETARPETVLAPSEVPVDPEPDIRELKRVQPIYPTSARRNEEEGDCRVRITINSEGAPDTAVPGPCPEVFREAAVKAALASRFYPYTPASAAWSVEYTFNYRFRFHNSRYQAPRPKPTPPAPVDLPPFPRFSAVGFVDSYTTRREVLDRLGQPDLRRRQQMYWGCAESACLRYAIAIAVEKGSVSSAEVQARLDSDVRARLFPDSDLPARVLGLSEAELTGWVGEAPASRKGGRVQWEWVADGGVVRMSVEFQAAVAAAVTWYF